MYSPEMMKYLIMYQKTEPKKTNKKQKFFSIPKVFSQLSFVINKDKSF